MVSILACLPSQRNPFEASFNARGASYFTLRKQNGRWSFEMSVNFQVIRMAFESVLELLSLVTVVFEVHQQCWQVPILLPCMILSSFLNFAKLACSTVSDDGKKSIVKTTIRIFAVLKGNWFASSQTATHSQRKLGGISRF